MCKKIEQAPQLSPASQAINELLNGQHPGKNLSDLLNEPATTKKITTTCDKTPVEAIAEIYRRRQIRLDIEKK